MNAKHDRNDASSFRRGARRVLTRPRALRIGATVLALSTGLALTGCTLATAQAEAVTSPGATTSQVSNIETASAVDSRLSAGTELSADDIKALTHYSASDAQYDESNATKITLNGASASVSGSGSAGVKVEGSTVTITAAGAYIVSGSLTDGQLVVAAGDTDDVQLVLDGASITNADGPALSVTEADEVTLITKSGTTSRLADGATYADEGEDAAGATVYSKTDLTFAGAGTLEIAGNHDDAINGRDQVVVASGTLTVTAKDDGIVGKDAIAIVGGTVSVTVEDEGLKSSNQNDADRGWILVQNATLNVAAGGKGIAAVRQATIASGTVSVTKSYEGIEAQHIALGGGDVTLTASDDGINATASTLESSSGSSDSSSAGSSDAANGGAPGAPGAGQSGTGQSGTRPGGGQPPADPGQGAAGSNGTGQSGTGQSGTGQAGAGQQPPSGGAGGGGMGGMGPGGETADDASVTITGGTITINADGDGLDSNGTVEMSGGTVIVNGPTNNGNGALDVNGAFTITGGSLIAAGSSGMAVAPDASSAQASVAFTLTAAGQAGAELTVKDASGATITTLKLAKTAQSIVVSESALKSGETYTLEAAGQQIATATAGQAPQGGMGGGGGRP